MIDVNLNYTYLISDATIKSVSSILQNVDPKFLMSAIRRAQDINLDQAIGTALYDKITTLVASGDIELAQNSNYKILREKYITLMLVEWAIYHAIIDMSYKFTNVAVLQLTANEGKLADLKELQYLLDQQISYAQVYDSKLKRYLLDYAGLFPELYGNTSIENTPARLQQYNMMDLLFTDQRNENYLQIKMD